MPADLSDYPRVLKNAGPVLAALDASGTGIPAWLFLGWDWAESTGIVGDKDYSAFAEGELGLWQLSPSERRRTGFTDVALMTGKTPEAIDYQARSGIALIQTYGGDVAAAGVDSSNDPLYWMLIKFSHGAGMPTMQKLVRDWLASTGGTVGSWDDFYQYAIDSGYVPSGHASTYVKHWLDQVQSIRTNGLALATAAGVTTLIPDIPLPGDDENGGGGGTVLVGLLVVGGLAWWLLKRA